MLILSRLSEFAKCKDQFSEHGLHIKISVLICYKVDLKHLCLSCILEYNMLSQVSYFLNVGEASVFEGWSHYCYMYTQLCTFSKNLLLIILVVPSNRCFHCFENQIPHVLCLKLKKMVRIRSLGL